MRAWLTAWAEHHRLARATSLVAALITLSAAAQESTPVDKIAGQGYPAKRITLVVPNSAGGAIDVAARLVPPKLAEYLGQPILIENRVAAGGVLATNQVAQAPPIAGLKRRAGWACLWPQAPLARSSSD